LALERKVKQITVRGKRAVIGSSYVVVAEVMRRPQRRIMRKVFDTGGDVSTIEGMGTHDNKLLGETGR
jgi:hypothetical protein